MVTVSRGVLLPFLAPILVPVVFSLLAPNPIQAGQTPSFLLATAAPTERLSPSIAWLDELEHRLTTYFTKKYPAYDFSPYAQELDRIRSAASPARNTQNPSAAIAIVWARGTGPEARGEDFRSKTRPFPLATSLAPMAWSVGTLSRRIMPDEEFGIVYPGPGSKPPKKGGRAGDCSECPNIRGRI